MTEPILGLDHVIIAVRDLDRARDAWRRLGFATAPLGNHVGKATANYCIMFPDTYLELLGINEPEHADTTRLDAFLAERGEGLLRLALGTPDADAARAEIAARGFAPEGPHDLARPLDDPPGAMVRFRNLFIPDEGTANVPTFLCGHLTPELMRPAGLTDHPNGATAFHAITAVVDDMDGAVAAWSRLLGERSLTMKPHGASFGPGRGHVRFVTPETVGRLHPGLEPGAMPGRPFYLALQIRVPSLGPVGEVMRTAGVDVSEHGGVLRVAPGDASGVVLEFTTG